MKNRFIILFAILLLLPGAAYSGDFVCKTVDNVSASGGILIAPGRNDGVNRLYLGGGWCLFEYTWQDSVWLKDTVESDLMKVPEAIASGYGRNDGVLRLYGGVYGIRLYEYSYEGGVWNTVLIDGVRDVGGSVAVGDIKNDDTMRVVAGGKGNVTMSYTYQSGSNTWTAETLGVNTDDIQGVAIGKGRNDDTNRVYSGGGNTILYEYWYSNNLWNKFNVYGGTYNIAIGAGRNDNINRLHLNGLIEKTWEINNWQYSEMDTNESSYSGPAVLIDGRNDGKNRLYVAGRVLGGPIDSVSYAVYVLEKSYDSVAGWTRKEMQAVIYWPYDCMWNVAAGKAHNDTINRIYAIPYGGTLFEFTWVDSINGVENGEVVENIENVKIVEKVLRVAPNPFFSYTAISNLPSDTEVKIYDITGRLVEKTSSLKIGAGLKGGVYFITAKDYKPAKIIKIK